MGFSRLMHKHYNEETISANKRGDIMAEETQLQAAPVITLPADFDESQIKLCKIEDPSCESCQ
jgi:hypothetical protein